MEVSDLERRLRGLSSGDRSVIEAAVNNPGVMTTSRGSRNDLLWSEMETCGWTKRVDTFGDVPELREMIRTFELTPEGADAVRTALVNLQSPKT